MTLKTSFFKNKYKMENKTVKIKYPSVIRIACGNMYHDSGKTTDPHAAAISIANPHEMIASIFFIFWLAISLTSFHLLLYRNRWERTEGTLYICKMFCAAGRIAIPIPI